MESKRKKRFLSLKNFFKDSIIKETRNSFSASILEEKEISVRFLDDVDIYIEIDGKIYKERG